MHIGGAANGLQFVVYDPPAVTEAESTVDLTQKTPVVVPHDDSAAPQEHEDTQSQLLYNPVTDLLGRLMAPTPEPHPAPSSSYETPADSSGTVDLRA